MITFGNDSVPFQWGRKHVRVSRSAPSGWHWPVQEGNGEWNGQVKKRCQFCDNCQVWLYSMLQCDGECVSVLAAGDQYLHAIQSNFNPWTTVNLLAEQLRKARTSCPKFPNKLVCHHCMHFLELPNSDTLLSSTCYKLKRVTPLGRNIMQYVCKRVEKWMLQIELLQECLACPCFTSVFVLIRILFTFKQVVWEPYLI